MSEELEQLAGHIRRRNAADAEIARIIGRPAEKGHIGEFLASRILDIELQPSARHKGFDGRFAQGPQKGRSVNVKFYGKQEGILDLSPDEPPEFYLAMTGPKSAPIGSVGSQRPLVIETVFLFEAARLHASLRARGLKLGIGTSVARRYWEEAEIYPRPLNPLMRLSDEQRALLAMFLPANVAPSTREGMEGEGLGGPIALAEDRAGEARDT